MPPGQLPTLDKPRPRQEGEQSAEILAEKPGKNAIAPPNPEAEYIGHLDDQARLNDQITEASEQVADDHQKIDKLRESMGLPSDPNLETSSDAYIDTLQNQEVAIEGAIKNEERDLLNVPDGEGQKPELSESQIMPMAGQETDSIEKMEKEARTEYVKDFIKSAIEQMLSDFKTFLDGSTNAEQARKLIQIKTEKSVTIKAKDFIENGGEPDFGFEAKIMGAEFDNAEGKSSKYVTELDITFDNGQKANNADEQPGGELIDLEARRKMKEAEDQGNLETIQENQAA